MKRFRYQFMDALVRLGAPTLIVGAALSAGGCGQAKAVESPQVAVSEQALSVDDLAQQCGFACPDGKDVKGIAEGNASISGVPSIDGFFSSVINFQAAANGVAAGIDTELDAIRADFQLDANADIGAALKAKLDANLEAGYSLKIEPAQCKVDIEAQLNAAAKCDVDASPGMVAVECKGGCDVEASADVKCDANADLRCTINPPMGMCSGECTGSCDVDLSAEAACMGTCNGDCSGDCSAYAKDDQGNVKCAGQCSGMCKGTCRVDVTADASCKGKCTGECTYTPPSGGCEGAIRAQCKAHANASIMCDTKCDADFEPPMVKAECQAKVEADAKMNVQCTPPHVAFNYRVKAGLKLEDQLRFEAALKALVDVHLPALKVALKRGDSVTSAGKDLSAAASGALMNAVNETKAKAGVDVKVLFGLGCAVKELPKVGDIIEGASDNLSKSVSAVGKINDALKI
jgi:hypothetical protein